MLKVADFTYMYQGRLEAQGRCQIQVYSLASGMTVVIATEMLDNTPCASMTEVAAALATEIRWMCVEPGGAMVWIEHCPGETETFCWVHFRWNGHGYVEPERHVLSCGEVEELIGEAVE